MKSSILHPLVILCVSLGGPESSDFARWLSCVSVLVVPRAQTSPVGYLVCQSWLTRELRLRPLVILCVSLGGPESSQTSPVGYLGCQSWWTREFRLCPLVILGVSLGGPESSQTSPVGYLGCQSWWTREFRLCPLVILCVSLGGPESSDFACWLSCVSVLVDQRAQTLPVGYLVCQSWLTRELRLRPLVILCVSLGGPESSDFACWLSCVSVLVDQRAQTSPVGYLVCQSWWPRELTDFARWLSWVSVLVDQRVQTLPVGYLVCQSWWSRELRLRPLVILCVSLGGPESSDFARWLSCVSVLVAQRAQTSPVGYLVCQSWWSRELTDFARWLSCVSVLVVQRAHRLRPLVILGVSLGGPESSQTSSAVYLVCQSWWPREHAGQRQASNCTFYIQTSNYYLIRH